MQRPRKQGRFPEYLHGYESIRQLSDNAGLKIFIIAIYQGCKCIFETVAKMEVIHVSFLCSEVNGAILYISLTGNMLHTNYSLFVFPLDKLDYR